MTIVLELEPVLNLLTGALFIFSVLCLIGTIHEIEQIKLERKYPEYFK